MQESGSVGRNARGAGGGAENDAASSKALAAFGGGGGGGLGGGSSKWSKAAKAATGMGLIRTLMAGLTSGDEESAAEAVAVE